ncbi:GNAT family N-acetyltransferase [Streptomyces sp. NPDC088254]|uniref:GNAT family N-acetyltransferase n=1 Tax=Streptomyces sp. NPDC088254 TaxID=3365847 RepID=UPI003822D09E
MIAHLTPSAPLSTRPRVPSDLAGCVTSLALVHEHSGYPINWPVSPEAWLTPPALLAAWAAEWDGRIVGHAALCLGRDDEPATALWQARRPGAATASVSRLFVSPEARGLGVGAALMDRAVEEAGSRGLQPVLEVVATHPAAAFYERLGWELLGEVEDLWPQDQRVRLRCHAAPAPADQLVQGVFRKSLPPLP